MNVALNFIDCSFAVTCTVHSLRCMHIRCHYNLFIAIYTIYTVVRLIGFRVIEPFSQRTLQIDAHVSKTNRFYPIWNREGNGIGKWIHRHSNCRAKKVVDTVIVLLMKWGSGSMKYYRIFLAKRVHINKLDTKHDKQVHFDNFTFCNLQSITGYKRQNSGTFHNRSQCIRIVWGKHCHREMHLIWLSWIA